MTKREKFALELDGLVVLWAPVFILGLCFTGWAQTAAYVNPAATMAIAGGASTPVVTAVSRDEIDDDAADQPILTIKKRVNEVNVLFIATDRHGKFVRNLNQNDFSILDDHKPVENILNFRKETDLPIEMGLLMDVSGSVQGRFGF
jgi:hypothetical protein